MIVSILLTTDLPSWGGAVLNELFLLAARDELFSGSGLPENLAGLVFQSLFLVAGWRFFKKLKPREVPHASVPRFGSESESNQVEPIPDTIGQIDSSSAQSLLDGGGSFGPHKKEEKKGRWRTQKKRIAASGDSLDASVILALSEEKKKVASLTVRLKMEEEKVAKLEAAANSSAAAAAARRNSTEKSRITEERNTFESQLKKLQSEYCQLVAQHADSNRELDTTRAELVRLKEESMSFVSSGDFNLVQNELFQSQSTLAKMKTEILDLQNCLTQASQRESVAVSELDSKSECIDELRDQAQLLESELIKAKEFAHHVEAASETEHARLSEQIAKLNKERDSMLEATRHQESVGQEMAEELQATIETRDNYRQKRQELKKKYKALFRKWESSKTGLVDAQGQFHELQQRLEEVEKENEKLNLRLFENLQQLRVGEDQFREFGIKYRKMRLRYKRYKSRMLEYKLLLEAYCRVTGLTPTMIAKCDSSGSPRNVARPDDPVQA